MATTAAKKNPPAKKIALKEKSTGLGGKKGHLPAKGKENEPIVSDSGQTGVAQDKVRGTRAAAPESQPQPTPQPQIQPQPQP
jgi:hypothetical protein